MYYESTKKKKGDREDLPQRARCVSSAFSLPSFPSPNRRPTQVPREPDHP